MRAGLFVVIVASALGVRATADVAKAAPASAQAPAGVQESPLVVEGPGWRRAVRSGESLRVTDLPPEMKWTGDPNLKAERENGELPARAFSAAQDGALQTFASPYMPSPLLSFAGLSSQDNQNVIGFQVSPPDTNGDVGPNH